MQNLDELNKLRTIQPRVFATRRFVPNTVAYEKLSNLIKRYGCRVSKVSDGINSDGEFWTAIYFDIPLDSKEAFLKEEVE
jgi:hypothetical protein